MDLNRATSTGRGLTSRGKHEGIDRAEVTHGGTCGGRVASNAASLTSSRGGVGIRVEGTNGTIGASSATELVGVSPRWTPQTLSSACGGGVETTFTKLAIPATTPLPSGAIQAF